MEKKLCYEDGRELFVNKLCKLMNERNFSCQYLSSKIKRMMDISTVLSMVKKILLLRCCLISHLL